MSGYEEHNFPAFIRFENHLRTKLHYEVVSPRELTLEGDGKDLDKPWEWYLRNDLQALLTCDGVVLMPGWKESRGARLEAHVADKLKMWVFHISSELVLQRSRLGYQGV